LMYKHVLKTSHVKKYVMQSINGKNTFMLKFVPVAYYVFVVNSFQNVFTYIN